MKNLRKHLQTLKTVVFVVAVFSLGFVVGNLNNTSQAQTRGMGDLQQAFDVVEEAFSIIQSRYVDSRELEVPVLINGAINGMVDSLGDRFSGYLDPNAYQRFNSDMSGNVEGIGVVIDTIAETGYIRVVSLIKGAAAAAAGVLPGDIFWEVDGKSVVGLNQNELASIVRGPAGTQVTIKFKRGEEFVTFTITRVRFQVPNVEHEVLENDIAYISLSEFNSRSSSLIQEALVAVDVNNRKGLILDLRNNPGGLLTSVVDISSLFIKDGVILYEAFGDGTEQIFEANGNYKNITVPIVVLVNEGSASASELFAGAVKDRNVATLIGETTFGKGTVQTIQPLSNGGAIRITIARWLTPNRNWIHDFGIAPDIEVPYDAATDGVEVDPQLDRAIEFLTNR
jgi:carboxyl-terminal processing protease